jgi:hypothetical protein
MLVCSAEPKLAYGMVRACHSLRALLQWGGMLLGNSGLIEYCSLGTTPKHRDVSKTRRVSPLADHDPTTLHEALLRQDLTLLQQTARCP